MTKSLLWAGFLAMGVLAAGCGDDDDDANPPPDAAIADAAVVDATVADATPPPDASPTPTAARGQYIVEHVAACGDCHTPRDQMGAPDPTRTLAGVDCFLDIFPDDPDSGCLSSRNLTNDPTGLMTRTDAQIKAMFLDGHRPDGTSLVPVMPYYVFHNMTDADADSIVLYLRTVTGVDHTVAANQAPFNTPPAQAAAPLDPATEIPMPTVVNTHTMRGRYLAAQIGVCLECHTPRTSQLDFRSLDKTKLFAGGNGFPTAAIGLPSPPFPAVIFTSNITPDATGIMGYTQAQVVKVLHEGLDKNNQALCPPMPAGQMAAYGGLTDEDANDIAAYVLALPPIANSVEQCTPPGPPPP
jgi:mono/diheme cytochrome c family protein